MGLLNTLVTGVLFGRENAKLVASFSHREAQERFNHEEMMEELRRQGRE